jgi:DNA-binding response OmpR family regulator
VRSGAIEADPASRIVTREGRRIAMTSREFDLLHHFLSSPGTVFSREQLLREVWGWSFGDDSTVTVHVRRLREKLEADPTHPTLLVTVWGVGYRWEAP